MPHLWHSNTAYVQAREKISHTVLYQNPHLLKGYKKTFGMHAMRC